MTAPRGQKTGRRSEPTHATPTPTFCPMAEARQRTLLPDQSVDATRDWSIDTCNGCPAGYISYSNSFYGDNRCTWADSPAAGCATGLTTANHPCIFRNGIAGCSGTSCVLVGCRAGRDARRQLCRTCPLREAGPRLCIDGQCVLCGPGFTPVDNMCVNLKRDVNHCGAPKTPCIGACIDGVCVPIPIVASELVPRLGHSQLTTTEMYVRADPSEKLEAIEAIVPPRLRKGTFRPTHCSPGSRPHGNRESNGALRLVAHAPFPIRSPERRAPHKARNGELPITCHNRHCPKCPAVA